MILQHHGELNDYVGIEYSSISNAYLAMNPVQIGVVNIYQLGYDALGRCAKRTTNGTAIKAQKGSTQRKRGRKAKRGQRKAKGVTQSKRQSRVAKGVRV